MTPTLASFDPEGAGGLAGGLDREELSASIERDGGFRFDYISDMGDGARATYSVAYLCQTELRVPTRLKAGGPAYPAHTAPGGGMTVLPRGQFLFVGERLLARFNSHIDEVGSAARIERFKQFIRFHLTPEGLAGYVIAVNDPSDTGRAR